MGAFKLNEPELGSAEALVVRRWIQSFVVDNNLCPFAGRELEQDTVRVVSTRAETADSLKAVLVKELERLNEEPDIETTVLVHPEAFADFLEYNDFLQDVDDLLVNLDLVGVYQVASFHPQYQFAGTSPDDAENYTNRSPYPLLHVLREASVERAVDSYPDIDAVPERNIELMKRLGTRALADQLSSYTQ